MEESRVANHNSNTKRGSQMSDLNLAKCIVESFSENEILMALHMIKERDREEEKKRQKRLERQKQ